MASGLSVELPLNVDPTFGAYNLNTTFTQVAKQNLRMVILTNPGERIMRPEFGVGIRKYLFEPNSSFTFDVISNNITSQVKTYLPYIAIDHIEFYTSDAGIVLDPNFTGLRIYFTITPLQMSTVMQINVLNN